MVRSLSSAAAACGVVLVMAGASVASPVDLTNPSASSTLAAIMSQSGADAGKFIVGDKEFKVNNFVPAAGAPLAFSATSVVVTGRNFPPDGTGFRLNNIWVDNPGDSSAFGFTFEYDVTILPGFLQQIIGVNLAFNGAAAGPGSIASVDESAFIGSTMVGTARVFADGTTGAMVTSQMIPVPATSTLNIIKDFKVFSPSAAGDARTSFIEQTFRQTPTPGAATTALVGLAVMAQAPITLDISV